MWEQQLATDLVIHLDRKYYAVKIGFRQHNMYLCRIFCRVKILLAFIVKKFALY